MSSFSIIGAGFIFDRHIQAINEIGGKVVAVCDIDKSKKYKAGKVPFYTDYKKMLDEVYSNYVVICTPNHLHWEMINEAIRKHDRKVICEKPPIINNTQYLSLRNLKDLSIVLQCRYVPELARTFKSKKKVQMNIEVHRDDWYMKSWKADDKKSGGLLYNIGCHYFDLLGLWFGEARDAEITNYTSRYIEGWIRYDNAFVDFVVSINAPIDKQKRIIKVGKETINLTQMGFESLHTKVYQSIMAGEGYKLKDFKKTLNLIEMLYDSRKS